jgi:hypothetical protein
MMQVKMMYARHYHSYSEESSHSLHNTVEKSSSTLSFHWTFPSPYIVALIRRSCPACMSLHHSPHKEAARVLIRRLASLPLIREDLGYHNRVYTQYHQGFCRTPNARHSPDSSSSRSGNGTDTFPQIANINQTPLLRNQAPFFLFPGYRPISSNSSRRSDLWIGMCPPEGVVL